MVEEERWSANEVAQEGEGDRGRCDCGERTVISIRLLAGALARLHCASFRFCGQLQNTIRPAYA